MENFIVNGTEYRWFNHLYAVSANGDFLRLMSPCKPKLRSDGYLSIGRQQLAHRAVALCWCDKPEGAEHVHHKNHNRADNRADNLEWVTPLEHLRDHHPKSALGHRMTPEGREKLRQFRLGKKTSEETKQKQRDATLRLGLKPPPREIGTKMGKEAIQRMRDNSPNARPCKASGVIYPSLQEAQRATGIKAGTIRRRCYSINFPDYEIMK